MPARNVVKRRPTVPVAHHNAIFNPAMIIRLDWIGVSVPERPRQRIGRSVFPLPVPRVNGETPCALMSCHIRRHALPKVVAWLQLAEPDPQGKRPCRPV